MKWLFPLLGIAVLLAIVFRKKLSRKLAEQYGEPDPLVEADVYLAYGRTEQAISLLEEALQEHPQRVDIADKLRGLKSKQ
jgi:Tfp pilus assembly protein FimV